MQSLKKILRKLGAPSLVRLYGENNVEAISSILHDSVTEISLVDLLLNKHGKQILAEKNIRLAVLSKISPSERGYILDGRDGSSSLTEEELLKLSKQRWGRKTESSKRLLEVLGLDESYLPEEYTPAPAKEVVTPSLYLFPHQQRLKDTFVRSLAGGTSRLLIHMPTGAGKTRTSIDGIVDYWKALANRDKYIVWLAHSEELCEQAHETFSKIWKVRGDKDLPIYRLWGSYSFEASEGGGGVIIAGFQKLYSMISSSSNETYKLISRLKNMSEIILVDEAHKAVAPTYQTCIEFLYREGTTKLVGLTATPGRKTEDSQAGASEFTETDQLANLFHKNKIGLSGEDGQELSDPIGYLQGERFLSKIRRKKVTSNIELELTEKEREFLSNFLELPGSVLSKLADSTERNALILAEIAALRLEKHQIIVFALSVAHAHLITDLLNLKRVASKCVDGNMPASERKLAIDEYKNGEISVLVNYGVLTTGFDAPNTSAVLITRPTASLVLYSQMIGRGIRGPRVGGNEECMLVDIEDNLIGFPSENQAFNHFNVAWR